MMTSGNHAHKCKRCLKLKPCAQITHCKISGDFTCDDCEAEHKFRNELQTLALIELAKTWEER